MYIQCRSKGKVSGGGGTCWRSEPLGGSGDIPTRKCLKSRGLEILFPVFSKSYLWFMHIANYLLPTLSQQTNAHWREYNTCNGNYKIENRLCLYLANQQMFTFQSHHSKFVVSSISGLFLVFGCLILLYITLRTLKNEERSTNYVSGWCPIFAANLPRPQVRIGSTHEYVFVQHFFQRDMLDISRRKTVQGLPMWADLL